MTARQGVDLEAPEPLTAAGHTLTCQVLRESACYCRRSAVPARAESEPGLREAAVEAGLDPDHPESFCQRCGRLNVWSWSAPSPLWNAVMRGSATTADRYGVVCPVCFSQLVEEAGIGGAVIEGRRRVTWRLSPEGLDVAALWTDADGRVWDPATWLWIEPLAATKEQT